MEYGRNILLGDEPQQKFTIDASNKGPAVLLYCCIAHSTSLCCGVEHHGLCVRLDESVLQSSHYYLHLLMASPVNISKRVGTISIVEKISNY